MRGPGPTICLLALVSACQTAGSSAAPSVGATPEPRPQAMTPAQVTTARDSLVAQQIANEVGPGASIRAEFANLSGVRRVVASFHLNADAYVLVGHIDADGVLRIVFPLEPADDGLVRGNRDYRTPEFFAGFSDQYTSRARQSFTYTANPIDSYDGRNGYAFIIASWRPMRLDQIQTGGSWDTFELSDEKYLNDPRPAIYELAAQLAGQNHEAYTVEFARYSSSMPLYGGFADGSSFGAGGLSYCSGYGAFGNGYSFIPMSMFVLPVSAFTLNGYAGSFYSRGQYFYYDDLRDCYRSGYYPGIYQGFYGNPFGGYPYGRIAGTGPATAPVPMRGFSPRDRSPVAPDGLGARALPVSRLTATSGAGGETPLPSPQYRQRGLITPDDPSTLPGRRTPTTDPHAGVDTHTHPTIQEMVGRRPQNPGDGSDGWSRAQTTGGSNDHRNFTPAPRRADPSTSTSSTSEPRGIQGAQIEQRRAQPAPQVEQHRSPPPQTETRVAPVVREAPSRPAPPVEARSAPPPTPPPSSGSSSSSSGSSTGSRPPGPPSVH
jgi:hypothetical protein